jgi:hypothetical protein
MDFGSAGARQIGMTGPYVKRKFSAPRGLPGVSAAVSRPITGHDVATSVSRTLLGRKDIR